MATAARSVAATAATIEPAGIGMDAHGTIDPAESIAAARVLEEVLKALLLTQMSTTTRDGTAAAVFLAKKPQKNSEETSSRHFLTFFWFFSGVFFLAPAIAGVRRCSLGRAQC
jgi:hypothetical protein